MQDLTIALVQSSLTWEQPVTNRSHFSKIIKSIETDVDIVVLPEMFTTGFSMTPQKLAETMDGATVKWMLKIASENQVAVCGSVIIVENGNYYNRFIFASDTGDISFYNKRHLFTLAGEHHTYKQGEEQVLIEYKGWRIRPQICYDLRFPVYARNTDNYDVLLYVANWPETRINAWDTLLKARAIENLSYVVGVNRVGEDGNNLKYNGHSAVYDALGNEICNPLESEEKVMIARLNKSNVTEIRSKFNFLNDRDNFNIEF